MPDDKHLNEAYLPIVAISAEASREKSVRRGHISTLHLCWARRPLVAWTPLFTGPVSNGMMYFRDPPWTNYPGRFYRIRSP